MDLVGNIHYYYNIHRILLSSIGLWPYQNLKMKKIQFVISSVVLASSIIIQFMKFFTTEYSLDLLLKVLSFAVPCMVFVLKYTSFCFGSETVKSLMESVISDWNLLKTDAELDIIKKHSNFGRLYTLLFALAMYSGFFLYMLSQFIPNFLDSVAPRNESRLHNIPLTVEYFVDQQEYYLPILLHFDIIALVGFTIMISTESLLLAYIRHAIGMFEISSYRIEHAFDEVLDMMTSQKCCSHCTNIINAVHIHRRATQFIEFLRSGFVISYFFLVGLGVTSFTVNLLRLFLAAQYLNNLEECIISGLLVCGHIYYIFYGNYTSQKLIDHSTDVFHKTYVSQWYNAPLHAQKLLLFMMQHTIKGSAMTVGSIFVPSLEGFTTLISTSVSYFTVIYSIK
ncbi:uncharacterized protein [Temnothorax longispinosus]|uniref:uncharacterized protein n=1 Tax=Temnothorax longispinosus TaxID=300112 RepID=UPI003A98F92D